MSRCYSFPPPGYQIRYEAIFDLLKEIKKDVVKERKKRKTMEKKIKKLERKEASRRKTLPYKKQRRDEDPKSFQKIDDGSNVIMELAVKTSSQISYHDHQQKEHTANSCKRFEVNGVKEKPCSSTSQESNESSHLCSIVLHPDATEFMNLIENWVSCKRFEINGVQDKLCSSSPQESNESLHLCSINGLHPDATQISCLDQHKEDTSNSNSCKRFEVNGVQDKPCSFSPQESHESSHLCSISLHPDATQFMNLIENWILDKIQRKLPDFEDLEWLLKKPNCEKFSAKKDEISDHRISYGKCSSFWPTACYLPEAEVHALPFTVPF